LGTRRAKARQLAPWPLGKQHSAARAAQHCADLGTGAGTGRPDAGDVRRTTRTIKDSEATAQGLAPCQAKRQTEAEGPPMHRICSRARNGSRRRPTPPLDLSSLIIWRLQARLSCAFKITNGPTIIRAV
jgi:hypothetical protein